MPISASAPPAATKALRLNILGDEIAVWDRPGDGLPLLMIHGNSCSKDAFRALFEATSLAGHRLIAFDLPGCGESADARAPEDTYTLPGLGDLFVELVRQLGLTHYILVGWSLGGHIAIQTLVHHAAPDGIVLTGTPPCGPDPAEVLATFLPVPGGEIMSMEHPSPEQIAAFLTSVYAPLAPTEAQHREAERADGRLRRRLFAHVFATPEMEPQRVTIAKSARPFALIQGRQEPFFHPEKLDDLAWGQLWRGGTQWIEGAGHAPFLSHPDAYARLLKAFADEMAA